MSTSRYTSERIISIYNKELNETLHDLEKLGLIKINEELKLLASEDFQNSEKEYIKPLTFSFKICELITTESGLKYYSLNIEPPKNYFKVLCKDEEREFMKKYKWAFSFKFFQKDVNVTKLNVLPKHFNGGSGIFKNAGDLNGHYSGTQMEILKIYNNYEYQYWLLPHDNSEYVRLIENQRNQNKSGKLSLSIILANFE